MPPNIGKRQELSDNGGTGWLLGMLHVDIAHRAGAVPVFAGVSGLTVQHLGCCAVVPALRPRALVVRTFALSCSSQADFLHQWLLLLLARVSCRANMDGFQTLLQGSLGNGLQRMTFPLITI